MKTLAHWSSMALGALMVAALAVTLAGAAPAAPAPEQAAPSESAEPASQSSASFWITEGNYDLACTEGGIPLSDLQTREICTDFAKANGRLPTQSEIADMAKQPVSLEHFDPSSARQVAAACAPYEHLDVDYQNACGSLTSEGTHPHVPTRAEVNQWVKLMRKGRRTGNFDALYRFEGLNDTTRSLLDNKDADEHECDVSPSCVRVTITPE